MEAVHHMSTNLKKGFFILLAALALNSGAFSHPGGHDGLWLKPEQATMVAYSVIKQFIAHDPDLGFGKLDKSWEDLPASAKQVIKEHDEYYIISFTNGNMTLYVLISSTGDVYDVNMTGVFEGLK